MFDTKLACATILAIAWASGADAADHYAACTHYPDSDKAAVAAQIADCGQLIHEAVLAGNDAMLGTAYLWRGRADYAAQDYSRAVEDFEEVSRHKALFGNGNAPSPSKELADAFAARAARYRDQGQFDLAMQDYDAALRVTPDSASLFNDKCWMRAVANSDLSAALADCNEALRLEPGTSAQKYILDSRGLVYLRLGRYKEALADYDAALIGVSGDAATYLKGIVAYRNGNTQAGKTLMSSAIYGKPYHSKRVYGRGIAKLRSGDMAGAQDDLDAANGADPQAAKTFAAWGITADGYQPSKFADLSSLP